MSLLITALAFFVLITGLILIHELGHYVAARLFGVRVEEFGFGLPPRIFTLFRHAGTLFTFNAIPFGGFVRLQGESDPVPVRGKGSFASASITARSVILIAGVFMNFLLALVLFTGGFRFGGWVPTYTSLDGLKEAAAAGDITLELGVLIDSVEPGGPAEAAGVQAGQILRSIDGTVLTDHLQVRPMQDGKRRVTYLLEKRSPTTEQKTVTVDVQSGRTGVGIRTIPLVLQAKPVGVVEAFVLSLREAKVVMAQTVAGMVHLFTSLASRGVVPDGVTGIVGIAQLTHTSVQEGWPMYLRLVALLSLSLAALNILPFPALDGGRLLFVLVEGVSRRRANRRVELLVNTIGFALLIALIVIVTFSDVRRLFS